MPSKTLEQLDKTGADVIAAAQEAGAETISEIVTFVQTQAPELANEIVRYGAIVGTAYVACTTLICIITGFLLYKTWNLAHTAIKNYQEHKSAGHCAFLIISSSILAAMCTISTIHALSSFMACLKPVIAPRLYLVEYFTGLVQ